MKRNLTPQVTPSPHSPEAVYEVMAFPKQPLTLACGVTLLSSAPGRLGTSRTQITRSSHKYAEWRPIL
ncbi:hypothetical protein J6590_080953 [Homalodisca vitripennis]|nr:hypothetical protein J6590_080953 [Homalodisca vitripennis]